MESVSSGLGHFGDDPSGTAPIFSGEVTGEASKDRNSFLTDISEIRRRARQHIEDGAVTDGYKGDRKVVLRVLNEALATEIVCVLRYTMNAIAATGISSEGVKAEFDEHV